MSAIATSVIRLVKPLHVKMRALRCSLAAEIMRPRESATLLDIGGSPGFNGEFDAMRSLFSRVTVVNLDPGTNRNLIQPNVTIETADGCNLPYASRSFDWTFSNAVIEHVGNFDKQQKFAAEMRRVARAGYFLSTPNRAFFVDPHTYLPYYHLLPPWAQQLAVHLSLGTMKRWEPLNLLTAKQLQALFPRAKVEAIGPFAMNLIAHGNL
jgi:hypothetical protein